MRNKTQRNLLASSVTAVGLSFGSVVFAEAPRGEDVRSLAGNCGIGSFPQTGKAGEYNELCDEMRDVEKCLALIKQHFVGFGELRPARERDKERAQYCLDVFKKELGLESTGN